MELFAGQQLWVLILFVALGAFWLGRMSVGQDDSPERRMAQSAASAELFSSMPPEKQEEVDRLIESRKFIEAIKVMRTATGAGLRESKLAVDERRKQMGK